NSTATPVDSEAEVIKSFPIINEVITQLNLTTKEGEPTSYEDFLKELNVYNISGTDVLGINYQSAEPEEAKAIVNEIIEVYLNQNISNNRAEVQAAREFILQQLPETEAELQEAEAKLKTFKEQNNIVNLDVETELAANKIGLVNEQIDGVEVRLEKVNSQIAEIEKKLNVTSEEAIALNTINDSSTVQQTLINLKNVEERLALERTRFRENSPIIIDLKDKQAELEKELQRRTQQSIDLEKLTSKKVFQTGDIQEQLAQNLVNLEVQRQSLEKELKSLQKLRADSQQRNNSIPRLQQEHQSLLRKTEVAQAAYKSLLNNLQRAQIAENQNVGNAQVVSRAVISQYPVSTSRKLIVAGGIMVGGILYIITAFSLELRDPSFKNSSELRQVLNYKILTKIPDLKQKDLLGRNLPLSILPEHHTTAAPNSPVSEAYKMLYTSLQFQGLGRDIRVIAVTSSIPQEGKSTVSANLASMLSQLGKSVLLIDGDLHQPRQHKIWELNQQLGLKEVLEGQTSLFDVVQSSPANPSLEILPAGSSHINYTSLLRSRRMNQLITLCRRVYDVVIIDTPPILLFSDALNISKNTDGVILVGRLGVTNPAAARNAQELIEQSEQRVLGMVLNGVDSEPENYYQYDTEAEDLYNSRPKLLPGKN
ncbi:MAG: polysaccharide biosynthesis tyrosine autokinase, partial [Cyanobacteria bacterium J06558_2]